MADTQEKNMGAGSYVLAALSFIPGFGLFLFGPIAIIWGAIRSQYKGAGKVITIALIGIALNIAGYGALFYEGFVKKDGVFGDLKAQMAQQTLDQLVPSIEYYKIVNGHYPETLQVLVPAMDKTKPVDMKAGLPPGAFVNIIDPMQMMDIHQLGKEPHTFFYQLTPDKSHYYLLGVGRDLTPFTPDDVLPNLPEEQLKKTGFLVNPVSLPPKPPQPVNIKP